MGISSLSINFHERKNKKMEMVNNYSNYLKFIKDNKKKGPFKQFH